MLRIVSTEYARMVGHCYDGLPLEACGLLAGQATVANRDAHIELVYPTRNAAESSRVYTVDPLDHLKADRDAEARGLTVIGVFHSHTHTDPYPSPTDIAQADPTWHYVLVSLRDEAPMVRSYLIADGTVTEEPVVLVDR